MTTTLSPVADGDVPIEPAAVRAERAVASLERARERTLVLIAPLTDDDAARQHDPLMSPIIWDQQVGHAVRHLGHRQATPIAFVDPLEAEPAAAM